MFAACAFAQAPPLPTIEMVSTSVNAGIGGQSGDGVLRLPNLGTDCARAGVAPGRITTQEKGEDKPLAATGKNARLRTNRNVVVVIEE